jgi:ribonuclease Z
MANDVVPPTAHNPYGDTPGAGISLAPYFRPTPSVKNNNTFFPQTEELGADEMRISFVGSCPFPPMLEQAATCIMIELGNGDRLFFDFGPGCLRNIIALQVPVPLVNDIFLTHLHVDHYGELPYLYGFAPWLGRWTPLRVYGPSGVHPEEGTTAMIEGMKAMTHWHTKAFSGIPVGDGYEVDVTEFDWQDDGGVVYERNGATVRHWRRIHNMCGSSAYRLDWNGLSFVWTGDGRPDELTVEMSQGVDVFVTELQLDTQPITTIKQGAPEPIINMTIDGVHTNQFAAGYMIKQVNPRIGMITHTFYDRATLSEALADVRTFWDGLFAYGAPDGVIVNVTKDAVWVRDAALPESTSTRRPSTTAELQAMFGGEIPKTLEIPKSKWALDELVDEETWANEIPVNAFTPPGIQRDLVRKFPPELEGQEVPLSAMFNVPQEDQ